MDSFPEEDQEEEESKVDENLFAQEEVKDEDEDVDFDWRVSAYKVSSAFN